MADTNIDNLIINIEAESNDARQSIEALAAALQSLKGSLPGTTRQVQAVDKSLQKLNSNLPQVEKNIKATQKRAKSATGAFGKFFQSIKRIAFYRAIRTALKAITQGLKEGQDNLVLWEQATGNMTARANETKSAYASMGMYLKNSLGAMAMPIMNTLAPAIQSITIALGSVMNAVNQFFAVLKGQNTYVRANTKYMVDYAQSLNKSAESAKKLKNNLIGLDELNIISENTEDNLPDYSEMFSEESINGWEAAAGGVAVLGGALAGLSPIISNILQHFKKKDAALDRQSGKEASAAESVGALNYALGAVGVAALAAGTAIGLYGDKTNETAEAVDNFPVTEPQVNTAPAMAAMDNLVEKIEDITESFHPVIEIGLKPVVAGETAAAVAAEPADLLSPEYFVGEAKANARAKAKAASTSTAEEGTVAAAAATAAAAAATATTEKEWKRIEAPAIDKAAEAMAKMAAKSEEAETALVTAQHAIRDVITDLLGGLVKDFAIVASALGFGALTMGSPINAYANGGFVPSGQLFFAREQGPEIVGQMGHKTAVANNGQIVEGIAAGVYDAVLSAMSERGEGDYNFNLYIDGKQVKAAVKRAEKNQGAVIATSGIVYG